MNEKGITQTYRYLTELMLPNLDIKVGGFDNEGGDNIS